MPGRQAGRDHAGRRLKWRDGIGYALIAASVWLAWEVIKTPVVERAPPALALRLSPTSPEAQRRAAEAALARGNVDRARVLADRSLSTAPFNARALRVRGLAEARAGSSDRADEILTLAGNWSLRDDPAHAWLVENRLRRGDYASSFAHADTLARRRGDLHPRLFDLFTTAGLSDPRALPPLVRTLATNSPWRLPYIDYLTTRPDADPLLLALGVALNGSARPLTDYESGQIYRNWAAEGRFNAIRVLAASRKSAPVGIANGDFAEPLNPDTLPLGWNPGIGAGMAVQVVPGMTPDRQALSVHYSGYAAVNLVEQLILLEPGRYTLSADQVLDAATEDTQLAWTVRCADSGAVLLDQALASGEAGETATTRGRFQVPGGCSAQWLRIETRPGDRRFTTSVTITRVLASRDPS